MTGFHYDISYLTLHAKSRYSGLNIWTRNLEKINVVVPDGCLFIQAGKQLEWFTNGNIKAGYHEVIVNKKTLEGIRKSIKASKSLWRVSSTFFMHSAPQLVLKPVCEKDSIEDGEVYNEITAEDFIKSELSQIELTFK